LFCDKPSTQQGVAPMDDAAVRELRMWLENRESRVWPRPQPSVLLTASARPTAPRGRGDLAGW
jgi:hypothetical protein